MIEDHRISIVRVRGWQGCVRTPFWFSSRIPTSSLLLLLEHESLREPRQVAAAIVGNDDEVLYADAADFRVVDAWLDGDDVAGDEFLVGNRDAGRFVGLQPDPVPGAVDEA